MYIYSYGSNKKERSKGGFFTVILVFCTLLVIIQGVIIILNSNSSETRGYSARFLDSQVNNLYGTGNSLEIEVSKLPLIINDAKKSVVGISFLKPEAEDIFDLKTTEKWGLGTGVIVTKSGYILTNQHIAQTVGKKANITLYDGRMVDGRVVWNEKNLDLAILKIDEKNLSVAKLGNSDALFVGDDVIAIGNPFGIEFLGTTTKGIISGLDRTFMIDDNGEKIFVESMIQADASINPGNSGGPLIDALGNVVGINTVKLDDAEGIGFAIPINVVKPVIEAFEKEDKFEEATLGIYAYDGNITRFLNSEVGTKEGIYVTQIDKYGPCGKTNLKVGDIIISIDDIEFDRMIELREYIYSKKPGDEVILGIKDKGNISVMLGKK